MPKRKSKKAPKKKPAEPPFQPRVELRHVSGVHELTRFGYFVGWYGMAPMVKLDNEDKYSLAQMPDLFFIADTWEQLGFQDPHVWFKGKNK